MKFGIDLDGFSWYPMSLGVYFFGIDIIGMEPFDAKYWWTYLLAAFVLMFISAFTEKGKK